ncbi:ribonuclease H-like domain-containing protein [Tanacetum coccineum]
MKGLSECETSKSNIRRILVKDIIKEVEDYLKTYLLAGIDISKGYFDSGDKRCCENDNFVALLVYVDDIIITGNNAIEIEKFKKFLKSKFLIKDLGKLITTLLSDFGLLACKLSATPLEQNLSISNEPSEKDP